MAALQAAPNAYSSSGELTSAFRELGTRLGWGAPSGAFEKVVPSGSKVLVKPNLVLHENNGPWSYDAVITYPAFIQCVVSELLQTSAVEVTVGDSPVQNCDFAHLLRRT